MLCTVASPPGFLSVHLQKITNACNNADNVINALCYIFVISFDAYFIDP